MALRIVLIVAAVAALLAVAVVAAVQYVSSPLRQASSRVCRGCVETHWNGHATLRAGRVTGDYRFTEDATWLLRFGGGEASVDGRALPAGCHEGDATAGARVTLDDARDLRLQAPAPEGGCAAVGGS